MPTPPHQLSLSPTLAVQEDQKEGGPTTNGRGGEAHRSRSSYGTTNGRGGEAHRSRSSYGEARQTLVSAVRVALQQLRPHFYYDSSSSSSRDASTSVSGSLTGSYVSSSSSNRDRDPAATALSLYLWSSMTGKAMETAVEAVPTPDQMIEAMRRHRLGPGQASHVLTVASAVRQWMQQRTEKDSADNACRELVRLVREAPDHILRMRASQETSRFQGRSMHTPAERRFSPRVRRTVAPPPTTTPAPTPRARPSSSANPREGDGNRGIPKLDLDDNHHHDEVDMARVVSIKKSSSSSSSSADVEGGGAAGTSATPTAAPSSSSRPKRGRSTAGRRLDTVDGSTNTAADRGAPDGSTKRPRNR